MPKGANIAARFSAGARVRVKVGVTDPDFPDMPLGGWRGTVREIDRRDKKVTYLVEVTGLAGADEGDESCGLLCRARRGRKTVVLPLADVEEGSPNRRLIEDYSTWFCNFGA